MQQNLLHRSESQEARELRKAEIDLRNKRLGITIFQISWILVFVCLIIVNWQLRFSYESWPPPGNQPPNIFVASAATIGLIISMIFARNGMQAIQRDNLPRFFSQWRLAIGLGIVFFVVMIYQFVAVTVDETIYGVVFRVMIAYHAIHALVIGAMMIRLYYQARNGMYGSENFWVIEGTTKLWYFVAVAWILFYFALYLI